MDDRLEAVRQVIRAFDMGDEWEAATADELPAPLAELTPQLIDAYRRVDLDWLLEHTDPRVEIVQLQECRTRAATAAATASSRRSSTGRGSGTTSGWSHAGSSPPTTSTC